MRCTHCWRASLLPRLSPIAGRHGRRACQLASKPQEARRAEARRPRRDRHLRVNQEGDGYPAQGLGWTLVARIRDDEPRGRQGEQRHQPGLERLRHQEHTSPRTTRAAYLHGGAKSSLRLSKNKYESERAGVGGDQRHARREPPDEALWQYSGRRKQAVHTNPTRQ